jgi:hypothetical protein
MEALEPKNFTDCRDKKLIVDAGVSASLIQLCQVLAQADPSDSFAMQLFTESIQNRLRLLRASFYQAIRIRSIEACEGAHG